MGDFGTKLYTASLQPLENEALFQYYYRLLPRERRRKTDRMRNPVVRRESLGAGVLLCLALADFGICSGPEGPADGMIRLTLDVTDEESGTVCCAA